MLIRNLQRVLGPLACLERLKLKLKKIVDSSFKRTTFDINTSHKKYISISISMLIAVAKITMYHPRIYT